jgi:hypothetical protein
MNWERENTGQIKLQQRLGYWIQRYAKDETFHKYLEIGSWNGRGSTICFAAGLHDRIGVTFYSLEINTSRVAESRQFWTPFPVVNIRHGRILSELPDIHSVHSDIVENWHSDDEFHFRSAPFIDVTDYKPEVVLLDGGEYLTYFEYQQLKPYAQVFLLDDTCVPKCKRIVEELEKDAEWSLIECGDDRNGWAVFQRNQNISKKD